MHGGHATGMPHVHLHLVQNVFHYVGQAAGLVRDPTSVPPTLAMAQDERPAIEWAAPGEATSHQGYQLQAASAGARGRTSSPATAALQAGDTTLASGQQAAWPKGRRLAGRSRGRSASRQAPGPAAIQDEEAPPAEPQYHSGVDYEL